MYNTSTVVIISKPYTTATSYPRKLVQADIEVQQGILTEITFFAKAY
jgi:hypothetical protein